MSIRPPNARKIIEFMSLEPLEGEGGFFRQTFVSRNNVLVFKEDGKEPFKRKALTAIYYFITPDSYSILHRLRFDEIFHFYAGDPVEMIQINPAGELIKYILGNDIISGQHPQVTVNALNWQGSMLAKGGKWALLGTTCAPGFDYDDFEAGNREFLTEKFPEHSEIILRYTVK
jgi:hypothetical protein